MKTSLKTIAIISLLLTSAQAHAGFQFTASVPSNTQLTPLPSIGGIAPQSMPAVPAIKVEAAPVTNHSQKTNPQPVFQPAPVPPTSKAPMPVVQKQRPMTTSHPIAIANEQSLAVGFGKDLPLVTALGQVVPEGYTYVMDENIAVGKTVSWNGGQPWPLVLNAMLSDLGLQTQIDGKIVRITKPNQTTFVQPQPSQPIKVASAPQYVSPTVTYDAPSVPAYHQPQTVAQNQPYGTPAIPQTFVPSGPTNILAPQLQTNAVKMQTTETEDLKELQQSVVPKITTGQWVAQSGGSLKTVLESWSNLEGVDLFWSADYDYVLAGDANISGNFEEAVEELLLGFSDANPKPTGRLHPNLPHGPAVLVIETKELRE